MIFFVAIILDMWEVLIDVYCVLFIRDDNGYGEMRCMKERGNWFVDPDDLATTIVVME